VCPPSSPRERSQGSAGYHHAMLAFSFAPWCSCHGRWVNVRYLPAGGRYTTRPKGLGSYSLLAQTEEAGARVRRAEKQRRNRHIACKDALLMVSGAGAAHERVASVQACTCFVPWAWGSQQPQTRAVRSATCMPLPGRVARACPCSVPVFPVCSRGVLAAPA
jgi:hypothetical protein